MKRILVSCLLCFILGLPGIAVSDGHEENTSVSLYGRLWPKVTYTSPSDGDPSTDITDALSRIGVTADYKLSETLTAVVLAEVRVNLHSDGSEDFFTEHLGYVGLQSSDLASLPSARSGTRTTTSSRLQPMCTTTAPAPSAMITQVPSVLNKS